MNKLENIKEKVSQKFIMIRYSEKCKKFNISKDFLEFLSIRYDMSDINEFFSIINKSKNKEDFINNIIDYLKNNRDTILKVPLATGCLTGSFNRYSEYNDKDINNIDNFRPENKEKVLRVLKSHFYDYIINNNNIKNKFHFRGNKAQDLTEDISSELVEKIFDDVVEGKTISFEYLDMFSETQKYIYLVLNNYKLDDILNNYGFIEYHMANSSQEDIEVQREEYEKYKDLNQQAVLAIKNIDILKKRLQSINTKEANILLKRLDEIKDPVKNIEELEDIYLEYEILFRQNIIDHLYVPTSKETIIEDFRDTRPLLIHSFKRNPNKFRNDLEKKIKEKIISERTLSNNLSDNQELTIDEQKTFNKLLNRLEAELDRTQVNYSFDSSVGLYSDRDGYRYYKSDTSNQIAASVYSEEFFWDRTNEMIGIGFDKDGLLPESIVMSSPFYLTTNKGIYNLEYNTRNEFSLMSANYKDIVEIDGDSEVVLFRRNLDCETKASYIFVSVEDNRKLIEQARNLAKKNNMKLVIYDIKKIRESYKRFIEENKGEIVEDKGIKRK